MQYKPFILIGPGDTIRAELEVHGANPQDLANITGLSLKIINQLINHQQPVTAEIAQKLSQAFGQSVQFWLNQEAIFQMAINMSDSKPILCLDFDGVIHSYISGWHGADIIPDPSVPGAFTFIARAVEHFQVHIFSSRSSQPGGIAAMKQWFFDNGWPADENGTPIDLHFPTEKPAAFVGIDDRVITFTGVFPLIDDLVHFKPWNKRGV